MKKRIFSILLTLCMVLSIIPAQTFAVVSAEASTTDDSSYSTIYFKNDVGWDKVYAYVWKSQPFSAGQDWPGTEMTLEANEIYSYTLTGDYDMVIFNNGGYDEQTADQNIPADGRNVYIASSDTWVTQEEAKAVEITEATFPDAAFRTYIAETFDLDADGVLSPEEIAAVTQIDVSYLGVGDLTGVKYFTALETLGVCEGTFTSLDLGGMTKLTILDSQDCYSLTSLDITGCTSLNTLYVNGCHALSTLDVSTNIALTYLNIANTNISSIDLSNNTALTYFDISSNNFVHEHCGVGYVDMSSFGDITKMTVTRGGTLGADGWLKLDDGENFVCYTYDTGNENAVMEVQIYLDSEGQTHAYIDQPMSKDETGHYAQFCATCRTVNETTFAEHTFVDGICDCGYACVHTTHNDAGVCDTCQKQRGYSVTVGDSVSYFDDMIQAFDGAKIGTAQAPATIKLLTNATHTTQKNGVVANGAYVVLDLNGKTLTFDNSTVCFYVSSGGKLTLTDSSEGESGVVDMKKGKICVDGAQLILDGGKLIAYGGQYGLDPVIEIVAKSTLVQNGGWIESHGYEAAVEARSNSSYTQNNGTVSAIGFNFVKLNASEYILHDGSLIYGTDEDRGGVAIILAMESNSTAVINGGEHTVNGIVDIFDASDGSKVTINGGTFKAATRSTVECGIIKSPNAVVEYKGGIFENGLCNSGNTVQTIGDMPAPGYVYYDENGDIITLTAGMTELTGKITVAECVHNITYTTADGHHTATCSVCGLVTEDNVVCTPVIQDADCTTEEKCACGYVIQEAKADHDFSGAYLSDAEGHWHKCANCEVTDTKANHSGTDDNDCTTAVLCSSCNYTMTAAKDHTGTQELVPNGVLHHNVVWFCCGAVVTENVDCTASNADGSCSTAETCVCGNLLIGAKDNHKLTYTASGNVITETCSWQGCEHKATATLHAPENPVYDGTQKLATVTYSDGWAGYRFDAISYSGTANDGSSYAGILYPAVKAGTVSASITAQSYDYTVATASVDYTIAKATPEMGTVSVESPTAIYPSTAITLARTDETIPGTLELNAGQTLMVGTQEYNWTFTPADPHNYNAVTGKVSITVVEDTLVSIAVTTPPEKTTYEYGDRIKIDGMEVTATYASGKTEVIDNDALTITPEELTVADTYVTITYEGLTTTQAITVNPKVVTDPWIWLEFDSYPYTGQEIQPNFRVCEDTTGNTVIPASEYTFEITNNVQLGTATVTIVDVASGNYDVSGSKTFEITKAALRDISVSQNGTLTYTGNAQTPTVNASATAVDGTAVTFTYCATENGTYSETIPTFTNAGTYTVYYRITAANHEDVRNSFEVVVKKAQNEVLLTPSIADWTYGEAPSAPVGEAKWGEFTFTYGTDWDGEFSAEVPTEAGKYWMRCEVVGTDNWTGITASEEPFTIQKASLTSDIFDFTPPANLNACDDLAKEAAVTVKEGIEGVGSVTVKYFKDGEPLDGAPTTVGTYTVKIEVAEGANYNAVTDLTVGTFTFDITDETEHTGVTLVSNGDGTHDTICTVCEKVIASGVACTGTTTDDCDKGYKCSCGGYFGTKEHNFSGDYLIDAEGHWHKCKDCSATDTKVEHSGTDDGTCTTPVICSCGAVLIEAKDKHGFDNACDTHCNNPGCEYTRTTYHEPLPDDGDCKTPVRCAICQEITTEAKEHSFDNTCDTTCNNKDCKYTRTITHTPNEDDGDCETVIHCKICDAITTPAKSHSYTNACDTTCNNDGCEHTRVTYHESLPDDGNCTTPIRCAICQEITTEAKAHSFDNTCDTTCNNKDCTYTRTITHTPSEDDGDCETAIHCKICDAITTPAKSHSYTNACDTTCNNEGCKHTRMTEHRPEADDDDCTTDILCSICDAVTTKGNASHTGGTATCTAKAECTVCGTAYGSTLAHTPEADDGDCTTDILCSVCDAVTTKGEESHTGGTATCTAKAKCEVCGTEYGEMLEHTFTVPQNDDADHWNKCKDCDAIDLKIKHRGDDDGDCTTAVECTCGYVLVKATAGHTGGTATCTAKAKCEVCFTEYGEMLEHAFTVLQNDGTHHWNKCKDCDAIDTKVKHTGADDSNCTTEVKCSCGYVITAGTAHKGGAATCVAKAKCEVCGTEYGELGEHGETEIRNAKPASCSEEGHTGDKHCKVCGEKLESGTAISKTAHTYQWVTDREATTSAPGVKHEQCACGAKRNENTPIPQLATPPTGDNGKPLVWLGVLLASGVALGVAWFLSRKKKK